MADTSGQAEIRGIQIDKISRDYENEALILKNLVSVEATSAREIRWYQKTSGFLTFSSLGSIKVSAGARPFVLEQSWTRNTSYVKKYFVESPTISIEDEQDNDVNIVLENLRDLTAVVAYSVETDIWNVLTENQTPTNINSVTSTAAWDAASGQDPYKDILDAKYKIRLNTKRKLTSGYLLVSPKGEKDLLAWIRSSGSTIPIISGQKFENGDLLSIAGLNVVTSAVVTADYAAVADLSMACVFKQFIPLTSRIINEEGIGKKIRVWEEGIALLVRPKYVSLISNTET